MTLIQIAGGVALILFGVRFLRKGLDRLFGHGLVHWVQRMTRNRLQAFGAGAVVGTVAPSSTALSLISLQLLGSGGVVAAQMLAVLLGANIGITVTVQLLALHIQDYAPWFLLAGVVGFQFASRTTIRGIGQCLLALGFILLAMGMIGGAAGSVSPDGDLGQLLKLAGGHPWLILVLTAILTCLLQSSTASIGLGIAFATGSLVSLEVLIPWVIGTNLGTGLTALVAGWGRLEGKRLALANLAAKLVVAVPAMLVVPALAAWLAQTPGTLSNQSANLHTGFNIVVALLALPVAGWLTRMVSYLAPAPAGAGALDSQTVFLDETALDSPSLALAQSTREVLRMADEIRKMLESAREAERAKDLSLIQRTKLHDDRVDASYSELQAYLSRISEQDLSPRDSAWQITLLSFSHELEAVGDLVSGSLCDLMTKELGSNSTLAQADRENLDELYQKVMRRLEIAIGLLTTRDADAARDFRGGKEELNEWCRASQKAHFDRLIASKGEGLTSSSYYLEMLNILRRINSHLSVIGYALKTGDEGVGSR